MVLISSFFASKICPMYFSISHGKCHNKAFGEIDEVLLFLCGWLTSSKSMLPVVAEDMPNVLLCSLFYYIVGSTFLSAPIGHRLGIFRVVAL